MYRQKNAIIIYTKLETTNLLSIKPPEVYLFSSTGKRREGVGGERGRRLFQIIDRLMDIYNNKTEVGLAVWGRNRGWGVKRNDTLRLKFTSGILQNRPSNDSIKVPSPSSLDAKIEILLWCFHTS